MAWRCGSRSISRSLLSTARASSIRSSPPLPRLRPPPLAAPRRLSFTNPRYLNRLLDEHSSTICGGSDGWEVFPMGSFSLGIG
ncbi:hypothetical protein HHK36_030985 [Tetracentron sinense]|uniref:Uncharacterized protein n=1 Tax=Tetracentron sinense TaxID=13715 RepID=A0A834Y8L2_TETSI|nr:hypothetical protein HHK36_030985 [Tetracentron sinense]